MLIKITNSCFRLWQPRSGPWGYPPRTQVYCTTWGHRTWTSRNRGCGFKHCYATMCRRCCTRAKFVVFEVLFCLDKSQFCGATGALFRTSVHGLCSFYFLLLRNDPQGQLRHETDTPCMLSESVNTVLCRPATFEILLIRHRDSGPFGNSRWTWMFLRCLCKNSILTWSVGVSH